MQKKKMEIEISLCICQFGFFNYLPAQFSQGNTKEKYENKAITLHSIPIHSLAAAH